MLDGIEQTLGTLTFMIGYSEAFGFRTSSLSLNSGVLNSFEGVDVAFRFEDGLDPELFFESGLFNMSSFIYFHESASQLQDLTTSYSTQFSTLFTGGTFSINTNSFIVRAFQFDPDLGALVVDTDPISPIPEPRVWLQLILGFALVGSVARRRMRNAGYQ
jgi:hypothetical protein